MPELPEVETIKRGLQRTILGKTLQKVEVWLPKIVSLGPATVSNIRKSNAKTAKIFSRLLAGQKISAVSRRAKMLILHLTPTLSLVRRGRRERWSLLVHLKMTGQLIFAKKGERKRIKIMNIDNARVLELPHQYTHVIFEFTDGSKLYYNDLRQFGYLRLVKDRDMPKVRELTEYGPEPLTADFTIGYLAAKAGKRPNLAIKQFLVDPKAVAGIGNIYSDEILYWAKIRPARKLKALGQNDWRKIYQAIPKVLKDAIKARGSSVGDFFTIEAKEGSYGKRHMVYGRAGRPCRKCKTIIKSVKLGGRTSSFCPKCQK